MFEKAIEANRVERIKVISKEVIKVERIVFINNAGKNAGEIHKTYRYHGDILKEKTTRMIGAKKEKSFIKDIMNKLMGKKDVIMIEKPNRTIIQTKMGKGVAKDGMEADKR